MEHLKPSEERVAVVVVHGVATHPRYEFQDQVSGDLCERLNDRDGKDVWRLEVINPPHVLRPGNDDPQPTLSRVLRAGDDGNSPQQTYYDVTEAYWSPIDKGATNWFWVVQWILRTVFAPFNTVARIEASLQKQIFDYAFIGGALLVAFLLFFVSLTGVWLSFIRVLTITGLLKHSSVGEAVTILNANANAPGGAPIKIGIWLIVGIIGAFLVGQAVEAIFKTYVQRARFKENPEAIWHRGLAIAVLVCAGAAMIYSMAVAKFPQGDMGWDGVGLLIGIFLAFQIGRALLIDFIVGFFGDVQIYTTRDENDSTFYGLRDKILDTAVAAIMRAVSPRLNGGYRYDRVVVLAHSLGATIATDALSRLAQICEQGALTREEFDRIRSFIMLGSSLEKTDYFFDVAGVQPTVSYEAWRGDSYSRIFGSDPALIRGKHGSPIFWINYWYFQDPICNEIRSYKDVCRNEKGHKRATPLHPLLHSDYLNDDWFWTSSGDHIGALDVIVGAPPAT
jgi:hypothetical protein